MYQEEADKEIENIVSHCSKDNYGPAQHVVLTNSLLLMICKILVVALLKPAPKQEALEPIQPQDEPTLPSQG